MILVDLDGVAASRPGRPLFDGLSLTVRSGDRIGVVGLNGTGKSTLLRVLVGEIEPESGVVRRGRGVRVGWLAQRPALPPGTARAAVGEGWEAAAALDRLGMGPLADADVAMFSGGQAKRVALARALVAESDLLVLDEPTNHLDIDAIAWLEDRLAEHRGGLVIVTHDRHVLDRITTRILELDRGAAFVHEGGYEAYLAARAEREEQAAANEATRRNLARRELAWLRRGAPARTRKPRARIDAATAIVEGGPQAAARDGDLPLHLGTPRLGDKVVELHGVGHRFGDGPPLFEGLDLLLDNRERIGILGANGVGKTTLLEIIAGRLAPAWGTVEQGPTVRVGYYDQTGASLDPEMRVGDAVAGPTKKAGPQEAAICERWWFDRDAQLAPIGTLSGGERRRLQLLLTLLQKPNVLLLDEPSNDLDLDTLRLLEDFLEDWPGALVVVSHDRAFLERTVEDALLIDGAGHAGRVEGGYGAWERRRRAALAEGGRSPVRRAQTTGGVTADDRRGVDATAGRAGAAGLAKSDRGAAPARGHPSADSEAGAARRRSPSTLGRLLREAQKEVDALERRRVKLEEELADAGAAADHDALSRAGTALAELQDQLSAAEECWLSLAEEAERS